MKKVTLREIEMNKMKFTDMFDSVEEACEVLKSLPDNLIERRLKGIVYLTSFKQILLNGGELSDKQITQLKRLSKEIMKGYLLNK